MKVCLQLRLGLEQPNRPGPPVIPTPSHQGLWQLARSNENICPFFLLWFCWVFICIIHVGHWLPCLVYGTTVPVVIPLLLTQVGADGKYHKVNDPLNSNELRSVTERDGPVHLREEPSQSYLRHIIWSTLWWRRERLCWTSVMHRWPPCSISVSSPHDHMSVFLLLVNTLHAFIVILRQLQSILGATMGWMPGVYYRISMWGA